MTSSVLGWVAKSDTNWKDVVHLCNKRERHQKKDPNCDMLQTGSESTDKRDRMRLNDRDVVSKGIGREAGRVSGSGLRQRPQSTVTKWRKRFVLKHLGAMTRCLLLLVLEPLVFSAVFDPLVNWLANRGELRHAGAGPLGNTAVLRRNAAGKGGSK